MIKIYKKNIIDALQALSNREFQEIAWFENEQDLSYSYNEAVLDLFYDSLLIDMLKSGEVVFSDVADRTLSELEYDSKSLDDDDYNASVLISLPEMEAVRQKAAEALALVLASDGSESTVEIIEE